MERIIKDSEFVDYKCVRELHVYADLDEHTITENELDELYINYFETTKAITQAELSSSPRIIIRTTDLTRLADSFDYIDRGWKVFIHTKKGSIGVKEGSMDGTSKEIRKEHNILKIFLGGGLEISPVYSYNGN